MRIGIGYDIHKLIKGRKLVIGGVDIPHDKGLLGHSDADVLAHAVCDALIGAMAKGDIGRHFPDTDKRYKGISSLKLLRYIRGLLSRSKYKVVNIDANVIAERPKMSLYGGKMCENIAAALRIKRDAVNVKFRTNEGLGPLGKGEGIAAQAAVLVERR
ncbi:MAG: 2-C-methyl-D-erythritol 2,4-cyclodiphosphate synthase [Candidatus Omnitrophica bacterium]|nr:2-C-methyl-D-erythritol 2,4-cyclodiphosphate synthase [Candidatus Omnitrophota bacterium]